MTASSSRRRLPVSLPLLLIVLAASGCDGSRGGARGTPAADGGVAADDAGAPTPTPTPTPTPSGCVPRCDGNTLHYCDGDVEETVDCGSIYPAPARGTCEVIDALGGAVCALQPGDPCAYETTSGDDHFAPCAGRLGGCVWTDRGSECRQNVGTCGSGESISCRGDELVWGCSLGPDGTTGQPIVIDCGDLGGGCSTPSCVDLPEEAQCADVYLLCGDDLTCGDAGRCEPDGPVTIRSCSGSTTTGACTNTADCAIVDGDPEGVFRTGLSCLSAPDVGACVRSMTGLSRPCSNCFATPEGDAFRSCAGF